ncbi:hypothetical protein TNCV_2549731 [Trichonephila clavipes]|nr:hypothetical protein TNCV_2549731 [Trichonephila clavipes]
MNKTSELAPPSPNFHTTPMGGHLIIDLFNVYRLLFPLGLEDIRLKLMKRQSRVCNLDHKATTATYSACEPVHEKKYRGEEIVMPSTSGYNRRPRRGVKVESRPTNEKRTQQEEPVRVRGSREHLQPLHRRVSRSEDRKQMWSAAALPGEERRNEQTVPVSGGSSRRYQLQEISIRLYRFIIYSFEQVAG